MFECRKWGAVDTVRGTEAINLQHAKELAGVLDGCCRKGQPRVVVDLERVPLIDSAGLEVLLEYRDKILQCGGLLKAAAPSPLCRDILAVTGVADQIEIFDDVQAAVASFAQ